MVDWRKLFESWSELSEDMKKKIFDAFLKKTPDQLGTLFMREPYAKGIWNKIPENIRFPPKEIPTPIPMEIPTEKPTVIPPELPTAIPLKPGEELKTGPRFKVGDKAVYKWTGEEYAVVATTSWPSVLVKDQYGHLLTKDEFQLVTSEEYEAMKEKKREETEKAAAPADHRIPQLKYDKTERSREQVLRDIFYATLSENGVPTRPGYTARWRLKLPELLKIANREEQEGSARDFAMTIVEEFQAETKARRERYLKPPSARERAMVQPFKLPSGWNPVEGGYLVNGSFIPEEEAPKFAPAVPPGPPEEERLILTGFMRRRCNHPDHEDPKWRKEHPDVEEKFPGGVFLANLEEERAAFCLPVPGYYRNRRFNGYCPWHRNMVFGAYMTTVGHWLEVSLWMFKVSGGRQGIDPGVVRNCGLDPNKYDKPVTWRPPGAVFEYWKSIGWRFPTKIEEAWAKDLGVEEEYKRGEVDIFKLLLEEEERRKKL